MSNRTLVELNHDFCPKDEELLQWATDIRSFMRTGTTEVLPTGVTFKHFRHHSEPEPGSQREQAVQELCKAAEAIGLAFEGSDQLPFIKGLARLRAAVQAVRDLAPR